MKTFLPSPPTVCCFSFQKIGIPVRSSPAVTAGRICGPQGDIYQAPILPIVDFNGDGKVAIEDLALLIDNWGHDEPLCDIGPMPWGDGAVDKADLEVLMSYWGQEAQDGTLLAHWKLDETEGMIAFDSAGSYDGTVVGLPAARWTGRWSSTG